MRHGGDSSTNMRTVKEGNRYSAMLRFILNPRERWAEDSKRGKQSLTSLTEWEALVNDYRLQSGEPDAFSQRILASTVLEHAPEPYLSVLTQAAPQNKRTYESIRAYVRSYFQAGKDRCTRKDLARTEPYSKDRY